MIIQHAAFANNWNSIDFIKNALTIVLGSFNPNQPNNNTDFYYGRNTNYFWPTIAYLEGRNHNFYFNNLVAKHEAMLKYKFCFFDVVQSIDVISDSDNVLHDFVHSKIFSEFSDQVLFTTNTYYLNNPIKVVRNYNLDILNFSEGKKIIHTMGNNTIDLNCITKWKEKSLRDNGFQGFINQIKNYSLSFNPISFSPSGYAVKTGGADYQLKLSDWLKFNLSIQ